MIPNASKCAVCQSQEHNCRDCPSLYSPLTPGFYSGGGGGGGHSHEEDDTMKNMFSFSSFTFYIRACTTRSEDHTHAYTSPRTSGKNGTASNFGILQFQNLPLESA